MRFITLLLASCMVVTAGCSTAPRTENEKADLHDEVQSALSQMYRQDSSLREFLNGAHGYAVFPSIGKGGLIVGGAWGRGEVYERGNLVGFSEVTQATVGAQLGGQTYAQIIAFETAEALREFKSGNYAFSANASAVALKAGAAAAAKYERGVAVFTMPNGGLMFEASIGGQKFSFEPAGDGDVDRVGDSRRSESRDTREQIRDRNDAAVDAAEDAAEDARDAAADTSDAMQDR
jgi:lipid-binding SYLF domain-containing protein